MDDDRDQAVLGGFAVGSVLFGTGAIEADHRIFHPIDRTVDADRNWVRIVKRITPVNFQRVGNRLGAVLTPKRLGFIWVVRHCQDCFAANVHTHRIPDEFATRSECKITHVLGTEHPCFLFVALVGFVLLCLFRGHDEFWFFGGSSLFQPGNPLGLQDFL